MAFLAGSPTSRLVSACLVSCLLLNACVGSQPVNVAAQPKLPPGNVVEFEYHGATVQLDSVLFTRDSMSGIPWHEPSLCCKRVGYALADISGTKIRTFPSLGSIGIGIGVAFAAFIAVLSIAFSGYRD